MTDLDRLYTLLTSGTGVLRTKHPDLEREAAERAHEARDQVGLEATGTDADLIRHPTQAQCEARLGSTWTGKGVGEIATWNYLFRDPIKAAADGLLNSPVHRAILDNPAYMFWGGGIYTELPAGEPELARRYFVVIWVSKLAPPESPEWPFTDIEDNEFRNDIKFLHDKGIVAGIPNPDGTRRYEPDSLINAGRMAALLARIYRTLD